MNNHPKKICLGIITSPHGVRGHVKVKSHCQPPENITAYGPLQNQSGSKQFTLKIVKKMPQLLICAISGVDERNAAQLLSGTELYAERSALPAQAGKGEYYHVDLIGLELLEAGKAVGHITVIENFGAGDIAEITYKNGKKEMFSFQEPTFSAVDLVQGTVQFNPPEIIEVKP